MELITDVNINSKASPHCDWLVATMKHTILVTIAPYHFLSPHSGWLLCIFIFSFVYCWIAVCIGCWLLCQYIFEKYEWGVGCKMTQLVWNYNTSSWLCYQLLTNWDFSFPKSGAPVLAGTMILARNIHRYIIGTTRVTPSLWRHPHFHTYIALVMWLLIIWRTILILGMAGAHIQYHPAGILISVTTTTIILCTARIVSYHYHYHDSSSLW